MKRKTIKVTEILKKANDFLEESHPNLSIERKAIANFTADILHNTGNYQGFNFLPSESNLNFGNIVKYSQRLGHREMEVYLLTSAIKKDKDLSSIPEYLQWHNKNADILN